MTQLELGQAPEGKPCAWCGALTTAIHQASPCCAGCAGADPKHRVESWLRMVGRSNKR